MDVDSAGKRVKLNVMFGTIFWIIGFIMILVMIYLEFFGTFRGVSDGTTSRLMLVMGFLSAGFIASGIFWLLSAIAKTTSMAAGIRSGRR